MKHKVGSGTTMMGYKLCAFILLLVGTN